MVVAGFTIIAVVRYMGLKREVFASEAAGKKDINITPDESAESPVETPEESVDSQKNEGVTDDNSDLTDNNSDDSTGTGEDKNT
jgi:hypothetical protein